MTAPTPRSGRPPLPEADRRSVALKIRMTRSDRQILQQAADAEGLTLSDFIRRAALAQALPR